jgi:hypothetical protein
MMIVLGGAERINKKMINTATRAIKIKALIVAVLPIPMVSIILVWIFVKPDWKIFLLASAIPFWGSVFIFSAPKFYPQLQIGLSGRHTASGHSHRRCKYNIAFLWTESIGRTILYVNHEYYTPKQAVGYNIPAYPG